METNMPTPDDIRTARGGRFLRMPDVVASVGLSKATINRMHRLGQFPRKRRLSTSSIGWFEDDINAWMNSRPMVEQRG